MMKIVKILSLTLGCVVGISQPSLAMDEDKSAEQIEKAILSSLRDSRPGLDFGNVTPSPIPGYYEVSINEVQAVYVSEDGKHFFSGELYFVEPGRLVNATEMARSADRLEALATVSESEMIVFSPKGETKAIMSIFTDVTCGYCRKLHAQMDEMNELGIEVRYLAYPRSGIQQNGEFTASYLETAKAWCADDRQDAMTDIKGGVPVSVALCSDNPLEKHFLLGQKFGVTGTPAIVMPDGTLLPGYRSPQDYAALLGI